MLPASAPTMRETDSLPRRTDDEPTPRIDPGFAEGRSRLVLFGGTGWLALGHLVDIAFVLWGGVAIVAGAFALNTAGKLVRYRVLSLPTADRLKLGATWVFLVAAAVGLLASYAHGRTDDGAVRLFWSSGLAGVGFGLLHVAARSLYLPSGESAVGGDASPER